MVQEHRSDVVNRSNISIKTLQQSLRVLLQMSISLAVDTLYANMPFKDLRP